MILKIPQTQILTMTKNTLKMPYNTHKYIELLKITLKDSKIIKYLPPKYLKDFIILKISQNDLNPISLNNKNT